MPSAACKHPTCGAIIARPGYCDTHGHLAPVRERNRASDREYDQHVRDASAKRFYNSKAWALARRERIAKYPVCERCGKGWSRIVHHVIPLERCTPEQRVSQDNLRAVCSVECHAALESEVRPCS